MWKIIVNNIEKLNIYLYLWTIYFELFQAKFKKKKILKKNTKFGFTPSLIRHV